MKIIGKEVILKENNGVELDNSKMSIESAYVATLKNSIMDKVEENWETFTKKDETPVEKIEEAPVAAPASEPIQTVVPPVTPAPVVAAPIPEPVASVGTPQQPTEPVAEEPKVEVQDSVVEPTPVVVSQPEPTPVVNNVVETPVATPSVPETPVAEAPAQPTVSLESAPTPVQTIEVPEPKLPEFDGREEYNLQGALAFNSSTPSLAEHQIIPEKHLFLLY